MVVGLEVVEEGEDLEGEEGGWVKEAAGVEAGVAEAAGRWGRGGRGGARGWRGARRWRARGRRAWGRWRRGWGAAEENMMRSQVDRR